MSSAKNYTLLYINFFVYSLCGVAAKLAGQYSLFSMQAVSLYCVCIVVLGVYAILWQQILKRIPLSVAYPNKAVTILLGVLWGAFLFGEKIKWNMILGMAIIVGGILLLVKNNE